MSVWAQLSITLLRIAVSGLAFVSMASMAVLSALFVIRPIESPENKEILPYIGMALAVFCVAAVLARGIRSRYERVQQRYRDENAALTAFDSNFARVPFFLYLRPFVSTNKIANSLGRRIRSFAWIYLIGLFIPFVQFWAYARLGAGRKELEQKLLFATRIYGNLVTLGKNGEHIGAGRIETSDDDWKNVIFDLMRRSEYIFLVPHENAGTSWEVEQILEDPELLDKTIVVNTPSLEAWGYQKFSVEQTWPKMQAQFLKHGFVLPNHTNKGALYSFRADKKLQFSGKYFVFNGGSKLRETIDLLDAIREDRQRLLLASDSAQTS